MNQAIGRSSSRQALRKRTDQGWNHHPDTARKPQEGKVVAVGKGKVSDDGNSFDGIKAGDKILFGKYSGSR